MGSLARFLLYFAVIYRSGPVYSRYQTARLSPVICCIIRKARLVFLRILRSVFRAGKVPGPITVLPVLAVLLILPDNMLIMPRIWTLRGVPRSPHNDGPIM